MCGGGRGEAWSGKGRPHEFMNLFYLLRCILHYKNVLFSTIAYLWNSEIVWKLCKSFQLEVIELSYWGESRNFQKGGEGGGGGLGIM